MIANINELQEALHNKLLLEGCNFDLTDILLKEDSRELPFGEWDELIQDNELVTVQGFSLIIKEYEHIEFFIFYDPVDLFGDGQYWNLMANYRGDTPSVIECANTLDGIILETGYYIAQHF